ncbi:hypothetical protein ABPG72_012862 [Tetrahymena utriculariae]
MSSSTKQSKQFLQLQDYDKVQQSIFFSPQCQEGSVTVVNVNYQLKNYIKMQKQNQKNIKNKYNHIPHYDEGLKTTKSAKSQLKISKIQTSFLRRCQIRTIPMKSQAVTAKNNNPISILSKVYDTYSKEFDRMCTYYALIKPDSYQNNKQDFEQKLDELFCQNQNNKIITNFACVQTQPNHLSSHLATNDQTSINQEFTEYENSQVQYSQNKVVNKIIFKRKEERGNNNLECYHIKQEQIGQSNEFKSINAKSKTFMEKNNSHKNIHSHNKYQDQSNCLANYQNQKNFNQRTMQQNQENQQNKRKYQSYESLNLDNEEIQDEVQKHIKNEQKEENINICLEKQSDECKRDDNSEQQKLQSNNQLKVKNNWSKPDQNFEYTNQNLPIQNFNQSSPKSKKNVHKIIEQSDFSKLNYHAIQHNKNDKKKSKLTKYYQELQMLAFQESPKDHSQSILDKCIFLTENSYVHSIFQNFLNNFDTVSDSITSDNKIQSKLNEETKQEKQIVQQIADLDSLRKGRTLTCFSRSSATTQHINTLALTSTLSISNAQENSASQEIIKLENNDINNNLSNDNSYFTVKPNLNAQKIYSAIQNHSQPNQKQLYLEEIPESVQNIDQNHANLKQHQQEQLTGLKNSTQKYLKNYASQCKSFFKLNSLTKQQQMQFRFSQYKKRNTCGSSPKTLNASSNESPSDQLFQNLSETQENQNVNKNTHKFGKYHNFNKLFMYNVLNMFQPNNLANMKVPEQISKEVQQLISKVKSSAKNNYKVEGKYAFDYFSHAHYNILFFQLNNKNIPILSQQEEYLNLYKECFNINLKENVSNLTITYINLIKLFCYQIFMQCIREDEIKIDTSLSQENLKNQYTLKVIRGIKKLSYGIIIKRF